MSSLRWQTEVPMQPERPESRPESQQQPPAFRDAPPLPFEAGRYAASAEELAEVRRRYSRLFFAGPLAGFAAVAAGFYLGWPALMAAGVIGFGLLGIAIGQFAIARWRLEFYVRSYEGERWRYVIYEGVAAVPIGISYVAGGACLIVLAALFLLGHSPDALRDRMLARPSLALVPIGVVLAARGLGFAIGFSHRAQTLGRRIWLAFLNFPGRLGGVILLGLGALALAIGLLDWLVPDTFDRMFRALTGNPWPWR